MGFKGRGLLHFAAGGGHLEACKFLVEESGFHVNSTSAEGELKLLAESRPCASKFLAEESLSYRLFLGKLSSIVLPSPFLAGETPILLAALAEGDGNLPVLRYLLDRGGDPAMPDARGFTPLHNAAGNGAFLCLVFLFYSIYS